MSTIEYDLGTVDFLEFNLTPFPRIFCFYTVGVSSARFLTVDRCMEDYLTYLMDLSKVSWRLPLVPGHIRYFERPDNSFFRVISTPMSTGLNTFIHLCVPEDFIQTFFIITS